MRATASFWPARRSRFDFVALLMQVVSRLTLALVLAAARLPLCLPTRGTLREGSVNCPNCGTQNLVGAKFCMECGTTLNSGCPNCGFQNLPGAKFCSECGTSFTGTAAPRAAAAPAAATN